MSLVELACPPLPGQALCRLDELDPALGTARFRWPDGHQMQRVFLVRRGDVVHGYVNRCPHALVQLDHPPGQFLSSDREWLECSFHGALFAIDSGLCVDGPCEGRRLPAFPVDVVEGEVRVAAAPTAR